LTTKITTSKSFTWRQEQRRHAAYSVAAKAPMQAPISQPQQLPRRRGFHLRRFVTIVDQEETLTVSPSRNSIPEIDTT
jgi:hypothetical protein